MPNKTEKLERLTLAGHAFWGYHTVVAILGNLKCVYHGYSYRTFEVTPQCPICDKAFKSKTFNLSETDFVINSLQRMKMHNYIARALASHIKKAHPDFYDYIELKQEGEVYHDEYGFKRRMPNIYRCKICDRDEPIEGFMMALTHYIGHKLLDKVKVEFTNGTLKVEAPKVFFTKELFEFLLKKIEFEKHKEAYLAEYKELKRELEEIERIEKETGEKAPSAEKNYIKLRLKNLEKLLGLRG